MMWPEELITDLANRRTVVFFGSGISMNSRTKCGNKKPISWEGFLKKSCENPNISKKIKNEIASFIKTNDFLTACELIKRALYRDTYEKLILEEYQRPGFIHAKIHEEMWKLDAKIYITPNFDTIYDTYVSNASNGTIIIKNYYDEDVTKFLRGEQRLLIKIHGSASSPGRIIFTRSEYAEARSKHRNFYELIEALIRTHTFLFIGCGLNDPDIRILLENYRFSYTKPLSHYFVMPDELSHLLKATFEDALNINILTYKKTPDHGELTKELENLARLVENKRIG